MFLSNENAIQVGGYNIANSLRFQAASTTYASRTLSTTSQTKFTYSAWVKRGQLGSGLSATLFSTPYNTSGSGNISSVIYFNNDNLVIQSHDGTTTPTNQLVTSAVYRDPSSWYHIVYAIDTTQATASNRVKLYVNGVQVTAFSTATYPTQNYTYHFNQNLVHYIGVLYISNSATFGNQFDGYIAEQNWIDGTQLDASYFGETNALTGQWVAKKYTGTYGTNGFYLPFSNGTSTTTLGADSSGNANNWTLNNFSRSAGTTDCWMNDVPSGNGSVVGGTQPNSNYAVLNPLNSFTAPSYANLTMAVGGGTAESCGKSTIQLPLTGKWYFEAYCSATGTDIYVGVTTSTSPTTFSGFPTRAYRRNGNKVIDGTSTAYGATWTAGDLLGVAVDMDAGTITFYKNNVSQGVAFSDLAGINWFFFVYGYISTVWSVNFGNRSFAYTPPTGFKALCTANLPTSTIVKGNQFMDATLYTGNGTTNRAVVNAAGFSPDFVWVKDRSNAASHLLVDSIRGASAVLYSNSTLAEQSGTPIASLNSNGFSVNEPNVGADSSNINGRSYVGWQWDAGSSTVTNTNGTISSQVRANPTAGVSVVTYTGTGANATVGHGLGVAPKMVIVKNRSVGTENWNCWHIGLTSTAYRILLNLTNAQDGTSPTVWNSNINPTSTTFSIGSNAGTNGSGNGLVAYCFAEIAGFSKFGSYTGNGSADGPFVYCGFRPKYVMIKNASVGAGGYDWCTTDTSRSPYNVTNELLFADLSSAESTSSGVTYDILSNGFKIRTTNAAVNGNGSTLIFMAFAENPFAQANAR